jgi:hypothetical protein
MKFLAGVSRMLFVALLVCGVATAGFAEDLGLVDRLTGQLGVTGEQAEGGAGAIFQTAKQNLSPEEFTQVSDSVPEATTLLDKAPKPKASGGLTGSIGGAASVLGGKDTGLGGAAQSIGGM